MKHADRISLIRNQTGVNEHQAQVLFIVASLSYMAKMLLEGEPVPSPQRLSEMMTEHCTQLVEELCREAIDVDPSIASREETLPLMFTIIGALPFAFEVFECDLQEFSAQRRAKSPAMQASARKAAKATLDKLARSK